MKRAIVFAAVMVLAGAGLRAAPFTPGDLVILRVGNGTEALTNAGDSLFLDEYTTNGAFVQSVPAPTNGFVSASGVTNYPIVLTGGNVSEGELSLSTDGRYLVFVGFGTNGIWVSANGGNISTTAGASIPRVVGRADGSGDLDTSTAIINDLTTGTGNDVRGVASTDGSNFWVTSSALGASYTLLGTNGAVKIVAGNKRTCSIFNQRPEYVYPPGHQQLYSVSQGGPFSPGTNLPTVASGEIGLTNIVYGTTTNSYYGLIALHLQDGTSSNIDTVYLADDGVTTAGVGGISKWTYNPAVSNVWYQTGFISQSTGPNAVNTIGTGGVRQMTGMVSVTGNQTNVTVYVTASGNTANIFGNLYVITDTSGFGGTLSGTLPAPIATAPANTTWRGVAFAPADTLRVTSVAKSSNDVNLTWNARAGRRYVVQSTPGDANGNYNPIGFVDIGPTNFTLGFGPTQNNYVDIGGATNKTRYYRVRLVAEP